MKRIILCLCSVALFSGLFFSCKQNVKISTVDFDSISADETSELKGKIFENDDFCTEFTNNTITVIYDSDSEDYIGLKEVYDYKIVKSKNLIYVKPSKFYYRRKW